MTGDYTLMKFGPITLHSLLPHRLPDYPSTERIVHVPMLKAVEFLTELDKREVLANSELQARNEHHAAENRAECWEEARERVRLAREGRRSEIAENWRDCERKMEEWRGLWRQEGFNERHAELGAMKMCR